ncbi:MAG TPA: hypothetical protein VIK95_05950 [Egibacteraceae bacterium]
MATQERDRRVVPFVGADGRGLSLDLIGRALFTGLSGIVVMLLLAGIADPLFRLLGAQDFPLAYIHRLHDTAVFVQSFVLLVIPLVTSFRTPERRPAVMVLAASGALITFLVSLARGAPDQQTLLFVVLLAVLAALHPARRRLLQVGRPSWPLLGAALLAAGPLTTYAIVHIGYDRAGIGPLHADLGHWQSMAGLALTILFGAVFASLRPDGWRLVAWLSGVAAAAVGALSVVWPQQASSFGIGWGLAAVAWGAGFSVLAEALYRREEAASVDADVPEGVGRA